MALKISLDAEVKKEEDGFKKNFDGKTYLEVYVCDQGHYGSDWCGNCNYKLSEKDPKNYCPKCNYEFTQVRGDYGGGK